MLKKLRMAAGIAISLAAAISSPASAKWLRGESENFVFYGDMSRDDMRDFAVRLERYNAALNQIVKSKEVSKVTIFVVSDVGEVQQLVGNGGGNVLAFYIPSAQLPLIITPESGGFVTNQFRLTVENILLHEYAHHMLLSNVDQIYPGWASEGMAEFFSTVNFNRDGSLTFGAPNTIRSFSVNSPHRMMLKELLLSDSTKLSPEEFEQKYSRGWLLIHYLLLSGNRPGQLSAYFEAINQGMPPLEAGQKAFGDLDKLNKEFDRYRNNSRFNSFTLTAEQLGKENVKFDMEELSEGQAAIMRFRIRSARGVDKEMAAELAKEARPVAALYPDDVYVQRTMAEIEFDANDLDAAELAADRVIAADSKNVMGQLYKARILGRRAVDSQGGAAAWEQVRDHILNANEVDPNYALPLVLYYDSYVAQGVEVPPIAMTGLARAAYLVPQDPEVRVRLGYALLQKGESDAARKVIAPMAYYSHGSEDNPALKIIEKIDEGAEVEALLEIATEAKWNKVNSFYNPFAEDEEGDGEDGEDGDGGEA